MLKFLKLNISCMPISNVVTKNVIFISDSINTVITDCKFTSLISQQGALAIILGNQQNTIIQRTYFERNTGLRGGALFVDFNNNESNILILNNSFTNNSALDDNYIHTELLEQCLAASFTQTRFGLFKLGRLFGFYKNGELAVKLLVTGNSLRKICGKLIFIDYKIRW